MKNPLYLLSRAALLAFGFAAASALAQDSVPRRLLGDDISTPSLQTQSAGAATAANVRVRHARASTTLLPELAARAASRGSAPDRFVVDLFDGLHLTAIVDDAGDTASGGVFVTGRIAEIADGVVVLVQNGTVIMGSVSFSGGSFSIATDAEGRQEIAQVATHLLPPEQPPRQRAVAAGATRDDAEALDVPVDSGRLIDIMVVYTPAARTMAGGTAQVEARIDLGVAETNVAYRNSGVAQRLRLIHKQEVAYTESSSDMGIDLDNLTDGLIPNVHTLRNTHGADLVKLITGGAPGCGIAWLPSGISSSNSGLGFSVTLYSCISPNYTFAHELGHNMGAHHDPANASGSLPKPYNRGYSPGTGWRTVMAYPASCTGACSRVLHFSNPRLVYPAAPAGPMGTATVHNNAHVLNLTAKAIANYRPTNTALHPVAQRFADVPPSYPLYGHVEFLAQAEVTGGCAAGSPLPSYCPDQPVTRRQMAVFIERTLRASNFIPPAPVGLFTDVPGGSQFAGFVEALRNDNITSGCAANEYCPEDAVTRGQMAAFVLRARCGGSYAPNAPAVPTFADVPTSYPFYAFVEKLAALGITGGCATGPARYCPGDAVTRAQMAAFIERAFPFVYGLSPAEACAP